MSDLETLLAESLDRYRVSGKQPLDLDRRATREARAAAYDKLSGQHQLRRASARIADLQQRLYAERSRSVLLVLQAMDAGGKDGTIRHVFAGVDPQGLSIVAFKAPTGEELAHDVLWRVHRAAPARGVIGVFNRSHYEDVLVSRVHPDLLAQQSLSPSVADDPAFWDARFADIRAFERLLARQGTRIVKVFLHLGRDEQKKRLQARLDDPAKLWKVYVGDLRERARWDDYKHAYAAAIAATSRAEAPWFVVPADQKWFARLIVAEIVLDALQNLDLRAPTPTAEQTAQIAEVRRQLA
ncbi:polyphosphate kinase 2 family protein [Lichenihabitans sp. Uapishka_5]|uniref:PPK2 family polyphosphate kinase n=1 Tax=Lichenihabitans sp. Uapishka_5 TaxID=3037302 RepID=UPI0029E7D233|nr:PPK2 family polyphosphate kinase [Lichenihabitans sp. Uapishka_5]MDX7950643.1 polyphosphate kinase 2 family protein [Lichenihabitans sp. Uapishka_5]